MDLNAPLGMTPPPPQRWRRIVLIGGVMAAGVLCGVALMLAWADPRGGRPYIVADLPPPAPLKPSVPIGPRPAPLDTTPTGTLSSPASPVDPSVAAAPAPGARVGSLEGGVMVYRGAGNGQSGSAAAPSPLVIDVTRALDDPLNKSRGPVASKTDAVPKPLATAPSTKAQARVAIFVSGMGLDAGATRTAIETMPAAVTLAFLPYGSTVGTSVEAAKSKGHEILLQLPMRTEGANSPGPHALRPDASPEVFTSDLSWLMDRFSGYEGVVNLLGAPVTADVAAMTLVLKAVRSHHLFYLDDGTSLQSVTSSIAPDLNVEAVKADIVLDATADPAVVRANLDRLVAIAKRKGSAIGMASGLPQHLGTIARFAAALGDKGAVLVPVSKLAHAGETQAAVTR